MESPPFALTTHIGEMDKAAVLNWGKRGGEESCVALPLPLVSPAIQYANKCQYAKQMPTCRCIEEIPFNACDREADSRTDWLHALTPQLYRPTSVPLSISLLVLPQLNLPLSCHEATSRSGRRSAASLPPPPPPLPPSLLRRRKARFHSIRRSEEIFPFSH